MLNDLAADSLDRTNTTTLIDHVSGTYAPPVYKRTRRTKAEQAGKQKQACEEAVQEWVKFAYRSDTIRYDTIRYDTIRYGYNRRASGEGEKEGGLRSGTLTTVPGVRQDQVRLEHYLPHP
jgi:hypothetical protein